MDDGSSSGSFVVEQHGCPSSVVDRCWALPFVAACSGFLFGMPQTNSGILYVLFMDKFGASRQTALWPRTIDSITSNFMGFVIAAAQKRLPVYNLIVAGAIVCPLSIVASAFVPNLAWMSVTMGFFYGASVGILLIGQSIYTVSYFEEYRGVATGITFAGVSLSGIVGPAILPPLAQTYTVDGAMILAGGILLNLIPLALMLRNPRPFGRSLCGCSKTSECPYKHVAATNYGAIKPASHNAICGFSSQPAHRHHDTSSIAVYQIGKTRPSSAFEERYLTSLSTEKISSQLIALQSDEMVHNTALEDSYLVSSRTEKLSSPLLSLAEQRESKNTVLDQTLHLFRQPCFYILLVSMVAADFTFHLFTATIVDYARDKGLSLNGAAQLVTCTCAGGLCGHLFLPLVAHKLVSSRSTTASVSFAVVSLCFFVMPSLTGFVSVSIVTFVSGAQQGYIRTLRAVLVADYLGADYVAMSWGIMGFAALPLIFCEPTIVGRFRDAEGSYDNLYRMCGAVDLIAAFVLLIQACCDTRNKIKKDNIITRQ
ncbi:monocarboxylate transporter 9-like [Haemaphysalis longicornis]